MQSSTEQMSAACIHMRSSTEHTCYICGIKHSRRAHAHTYTLTHMHTHMHKHTHTCTHVGVITTNYGHYKGEGGVSVRWCEEKEMRCRMACLGNRCHMMMLLASRSKGFWCPRCLLLMQSNRTQACKKGRTY